MSLMIIRSVLLYFITLAAMRAMGKRELGQLQPFEFVILLIISEMASLAMQGNNMPLLISVVPILVLSLLQISLSLLNLKSESLRKIICGKPTIVMSNGVFLRREMRRLRLNLNDVQELCRAQGYFDISRLHTIVMETSGQLSVFPKSMNRPVEGEDLGLKIEQEMVAELLILDGKINAKALRDIGKDLNWLQKQLRRAGAGQAHEIFLAGTDARGRFFWQKQGKED